MFEVHQHSVCQVQQAFDVLIHQRLTRNWSRFPSARPAVLKHNQLGAARAVKDLDQAVPVAALQFMGRGKCAPSFPSRSLCISRPERRMLTDGRDEQHIPRL
jgi:hypothetical protein